MIPRENNRGRSFHGWFLYHLRDKQATTRKRVGWTHTLNMLTQDPDKAWKVMAYTAMSADRLKESSEIKRTGRKLEHPVFSYSLAWHPEQTPTKEEMLEAAHRSIAAIGMSEHEAMIVEHTDEPQPHIHICINRVHPVLGLAADDSFTKRKLSDFALQLEVESGQIYCEQRKENKKMREQGKQTKYKDPNIKNAWKKSSNGREFITELRQNGYQLALGRKQRLVVVDPHSKILNPTRHLEQVKAKEFREKLADLDLRKLPDADELSKQVQEIRDSEYRQAQQYDEQATEHINQLQDRHLDEQNTLYNQYARKIRKEESVLNTHYNFEQQEAEISALEKRCQSPGFFKKFFGFAKKDRIKLNDLKKSYENGVHRYDERIGTLENKREQAMDELLQKQNREKEDLQNRLKGRRPLLEPKAIVPIAQHAIGHAHNNARTRKGPELKM